MIGTVVPLFLIRFCFDFVSSETGQKQKRYRNEIETCRKQRDRPNNKPNKKTKSGKDFIRDT
jgi:hypothetical protein